MTFEQQLFAKYPALENVLKSDTTPAYCKNGWETMLRIDDTGYNFVHGTSTIERAKHSEVDVLALDSAPPLKSALIETLAEIERLTLKLFMAQLDLAKYEIVDLGEDQ